MSWVAVPEVATNIVEGALQLYEAYQYAEEEVGKIKDVYTKGKNLWNDTQKIYEKSKSRKSKHKAYDLHSHKNRLKYVPKKDPIGTFRLYGLPSIQATYNLRAINPVHDLTNIPRAGPTDMSCNLRMSNQIKIKGVHLSYFIRNNAYALVETHVAIVKCKNRQEFDGTNFFQSDSFSTSRPMVSTAPCTSGIEVSSLAINPDEFDVLYHRKHMLGTKLATTDDVTTTGFWANGLGNMPTWAHSTCYVPLNQITNYLDLDGTDAINAIQLIVYGVNVNDVGTTITQTATLLFDCLAQVEYLDMV